MKTITLNKPMGMLIDGEYVQTKKTIPVINPSNEEVIAEVPDASREDLDKAVAAAREAFPAWSSRPTEERAELLMKLADVIEKNKEELTELLMNENGKPLQASQAEMEDSIRWYRAIASQRLEEEILEDSEVHKVVLQYVPLGVVGAIVPWNYPMNLAAWKIAPALLTGNTLVVKPSPNTPLSTLRMAELAKDLFPKGVLNVISGGDDLGPWMTAHEGMDKISFTGSTATGKKVMKSASDNLKRTTLELGGNDAAIVLPDADPKQVVEGLFWAAFANTGQVCVDAKRLYIHEKMYDEVLEEMITYAKTIQVGDPSDPKTGLGPLQNKMQYDKVKELIKETKDSGARIAYEGEIPAGKGYYIPVTIVDNPPEDSRLVQEEPFGPIVPLLKYKDMDEAVQRANHTKYGLAGSVWGKDLELAYDVASRLETGTVWINESQVMQPDFPFGGHKESGIGVEHGKSGLAAFTNSRTVMIKKK
ncbi:aldehyde dehydrogenase family protein [Paenibacillus polygoni]|uniref:Aldehyde dehydrogenase family protein n=1 Tax=Paenibacillus polygoni TaxID=3050112 RepID=A0ABY8WYT4_9BACL|nr:aldehyde dehydrogenase family protein [Paenibacillus polygoni]WIV18366.1 aldehyde dehydrogenase family protein [Paenibacillus polygoni]